MTDELKTDDIIKKWIDGEEEDNDRKCDDKEEVAV